MLLPCVAHAQQSDVTLGEIVVTAQKRAENLQDVPISVSAQTETMLRAADVRSVQDLTNVVPGLRAHNQSGNYFQPFIRGVGGASTLAGNEAAVATYIDGMYLAYKPANIFELNNVERIEVLRGPQGTLFGRNATGGAINIITRAPSDAPEFRGEASYGRFDDVIASGTLSGPLTESLGGLLALRYEDIGKGYAHNIVTGSDLGTSRSMQGMGKLRWRPTDALTITGEAIYSFRKQSDDDSASINPAFPSKADRVPGAIVAHAPYVSSATSDPPNRLRDWKYILNARYGLPDYDLTSITAYERGSSLAGFDRDRSSATLVNSYTLDFDREFTQEFQVASKYGGGFNWIGGAYYFRDNEGYKPNAVFTNVPGSGTPQDLASVSGRPGVTYPVVYANQVAESVAAFAEATFKLSDRTRLITGARYTTERRALSAQRFNLTAPPPGNAFVSTLTQSANLSTTFSRATYRVSLDHHFTDEILGYVSLNTGFRSGAYNPTSASPTQQPLRPELITAYEAGVKSQFLQDRLRLNASTFYYDYRDLHVSIRTPSSGVITQQNAGGAKIYGLDLDFAARPTERLTLNGGLNLLHAQYTDFANAAEFVFDPIAGGGVQLTIPNARGEPLNFSPSWTANIEAQYKIPLRNGSTIQVEGNYFYTDSFSRQIGQGDEVRAYGNLNASATWYNTDRSYYVRAWGRNITNHKVLGSQLDSFALFYIVQRPVSYGITLGYCFGGRC